MFDLLTLCNSTSNLFIQQIPGLRVFDMGPFILQFCKFLQLPIG